MKRTFDIEVTIPSILYEFASHLSVEVIVTLKIVSLRGP